MKRIKVLMMLLVVLTACYKSPVDPPQPPGKTSDIVQIMYVRILPTIDPTRSTWGPNLWSDEFGGIDLPHWTSIDVDRWQAEKELDYSTRKYHPYVIDGNVMKLGEYASVAEDIYVRVKGAGEWKKSPVSENGVMLGKWGNFYLDNNGIHF